RPAGSARSSAMKVTSLETYFLSAPLPQAVRTSTHRITSVSEVIVRLSTDAGLMGIGEAHGPFLFQQGPDGLRTVKDILTAITPLVVGQDPFDTERIWQDLFALTYTSVRGIPTLARQQRPLVTAMSAIDIALWDLKGQSINRPVWALLGGALRERVPAYVTGFYYRDGERPDDLVREAAMYVEQGYRTVKVKVGGLSPEADAERVGRIRKAVGGDVAIMLDANQGWNLPTWRKAAVMAELYQVPLAAHHDPQIHVHAVAASPTGFILESFADPTREPLWFELFRERPSIVDGFMALPEAPGLGLALRDETPEQDGVKIA